VAAELQQAVFPPLPEAVPGWSVTGHYRPSGRTEVGGDFFDVCPLEDGRVAFFVGDVMGRGVAAAASMAQVRSALRAYLAVDPAPDKVLPMMDRYFRTYHVDQLVTLTYGVESADRSELRLANAGHPPPVLLRRTGVELLQPADDPPIGLGEHRTVRSLELQPGDGILLYTDGLVERRDEDIDVGIARLVEALAEGRELVEQRLDEVVDLVRDPTRDDDVAALLLRREPVAVARAV
jgi:serine phosphatase RsbU (regulator of sigma subunit)